MSDIQTGLEGIFRTLIDLTSKLILPNWDDVITQLLPLAVLLGVVGPILSLLAVYWVYQTAKRPRFRVRAGSTGPLAARIDADGQAQVPPNVPFCSRDALLYPPRSAKCSTCGDELSVRCPVDDSWRSARLETCSACGTRYVLGASDTALAVRRSSGPPKGGAAVA